MNPQQEPYPPQQPKGPEPLTPARTKRWKWPWIVGGVVVFLLLIMMDAAVGAGNRNGGSSSAAVETSAQPAAVAAAGPARFISARDWAMIAKDPDSHVGESIIVYGEVTQFDSVTGTDTFRANVDGAVHQVTYGFSGYETNTVLTGGGADLSNLVEGDLFEADVVVAGLMSYDNTMGGSLTAPKLMVTNIKILGSTK